MKTPLAFISYDYKLSDSERARFIEEIDSCSLQFAVDDWSSEPKSPRGDWNKMVHSMIGRCDLMIVLVANGMDKAPVEQEILEARRCNVPFFGVYAGGAEAGCELPDGLPANRVLPWDWSRIASAIGQVTKEGKHHVFR